MAKKSTFTFYGKIRKLKENGYTENSTQDWTNKQLQFQVISGNNVHYMKLRAFLWADESKRQSRVYSLAKNPATNKSDAMMIKWDERFDEAVIDKIAPYSLYEVDTDTAEHRAELESMEDKSLYNKSLSKKKRFIFDSDFIDYVNKVINNDKSKDMIFKITGEVKYSYSAEKQQYYREFNPTKIVRVAPDTPQTATATTRIFFTPSDIDKSYVEETGDIIINTHTQYYDSNVKNDAFAPVSFRLKADEKFASGIMRKMEADFPDDVLVRELGLVYDCINGAKQVEFTEDMMTEEQRQDIEDGLCTFEELQAQMGNIQGDKITENRITGILKSYIATGVLNTGFTDAQLNAPPKSADDTTQVSSADSKNDAVKTEKTQPSNEKPSGVNTENAVDIFNDDDEI